MAIPRLTVTPPAFCAQKVERVDVDRGILVDHVGTELRAGKPIGVVSAASEEIVVTTAAEEIIIVGAAVETDHWHCR